VQHHRRRKTVSDNTVATTTSPMVIHAKLIARGLTHDFSMNLTPCIHFAQTLKSKGFNLLNAAWQARRAHSPVNAGASFATHPV